jgi:DNA-binding IclR family transcriptional regulator
MAQRVQSVERALSLLEVIAQAQIPPTVTELAVTAGVNRATAWRLLNTLEYFDLINKDSQTGRFHVGPGILHIATAADSQQIAKKVRPLLEQAAKQTGGSAYLEIESRGNLIVLDECRSDSLIQIDLAGLNVPHHCGSVGKLFLASFPAASLENYLSQPLEKISPGTITDPVALKREISQARKTGIAFNYGEHRSEWCGISAAIRDSRGRDLAFVNSTMPSANITRTQLEGLAPVMQSIAHSMAQLLTGVASEPG